MALDADAIIAALALAPHPEGGWYRETFVMRRPAAGAAH
jgi:predicted cupin superfamily sugar epimerase